MAELDSEHRLSGRLDVVDIDNRVLVMRPNQ